MLRKFDVIRSPVAGFTSSYRPEYWPPEIVNKNILSELQIKEKKIIYKVSGC